MTRKKHKMIIKITKKGEPSNFSGCSLEINVNSNTYIAQPKHEIIGLIFFMLLQYICLKHASCYLHCSYK